MKRAIDTSFTKCTGRVDKMSKGMKLKCFTRMCHKIRCYSRFQAGGSDIFRSVTCSFLIVNVPLLSSDPFPVNMPVLSQNSGLFKLDDVRVFDGLKG